MHPVSHASQCTSTTRQLAWILDSFHQYVQRCFICSLIGGNGWSVLNMIQDTFIGLFMDFVEKKFINARQKVWHQERFYQEIWHQVYAFCEDGVVKTLWRAAFAIQSLKEGNLKKFHKYFWKRTRSRKLTWEGVQNAPILDQNEVLKTWSFKFTWVHTTSRSSTLAN